MDRPGLATSNWVTWSFQSKMAVSVALRTPTLTE